MIKIVLVFEGHVVKFWDVQMTKRKNKEPQPVSLSKREKQWLDKVDWDLHEQLEMEEEGQPVPMQDLPELQFKPMDQASYQDVARVDPPNGLLSQVPPRVDTVEGILSPLRRAEEAKDKKPK